MAGYFWNLYEYFCDCQKYADKIDSVLITNTANTHSEFSNIKVVTSFGRSLRRKISELSFDIFEKPMSNEVHEELQSLQREYSDISIAFDRDYYKFKYSSWVYCVESAFNIYDDIYYGFQKMKIEIPIEIEILGFSNINDAIDRAKEKDVDDLLKSDEMNEIKTIIKNENKWIESQLCRLDNKIRTQKDAYILSKMIDGKIQRSEFKKYPELIKTIDAYIDVKKALNKRSY